MQTNVRHDIPLIPNFDVCYEAVNDLVRMPTARTRVMKDIISSITYSVWLGARIKVGKPVSYSRSKVWYDRNPLLPGYRSTVGTVDTLDQLGYFSEHDIRPAGKKGTGIQSSFIPHEALAEVIFPKADYKVLRLIRLRNADKVDIALGELTTREERMARFVHSVNEVNATADLHIHVPGQVYDPAANIVKFSEDKDGRASDFSVILSMNRLYRVFNRSYEEGGRFYGGWWQRVSPSARKHISINGYETVEVDYKTLHPTLLYRSKGIINPTDFDAYDIPSVNSGVVSRKSVKQAVNIILNADSEADAYGAVTNKTDIGHYSKQVIKEIETKHKSIRDYFYSGVGRKLQFIDSCMARDIMNTLTVKGGEVCLPIHDSFIVQASQEQKLREAMEAALERHSVLNQAVGDYR